MSDYTTQELIQILANERQACLQGQRLNLAVKASGNFVIDKYLKIEGLQKFTAYQDFKAAVHRYQRENDVSGIVWRQLTVKGKTLSYPEVDAQLIAVQSDIELLKNFKAHIIAFWDLWKSENSNFLEIILQLGWGQPQEAAYRRGWPDSGSEYIHAVNPGNRPIC